MISDKNISAKSLAIGTLSIVWGAAGMSRAGFSYSGHITFLANGLGVSDDTNRLKIYCYLTPDTPGITHYTKNGLYEDF
jgi:hypothetical protein